MVQMRNAYNISAGKPEGKKSLGRPRCRWQNNIRMDLGGMGWDSVSYYYYYYYYYYY
jgi:hypothetical protein